MATSLLLFRAPVAVLSNPNSSNHRRNGLSHSRTPLRFLPIAKIQPIKASSSHSSPTLTLKTPKIPSQCPLLTDSTRTVATILSLSLSLSGLFVKSIQNFALSLIPNPQQFLSLQSLQHNMVHTAGPAFFAMMRDRSSASLNTPLTVVAAGLAKWLDIYSGVLMVRVLLSWFPNIPWDRQPLSAIRDLCDPYLNLFRNIIPPVFDTLDVSPLLAFAVLGTLASIMHTTVGA
ncbi:ylmG-like protein 1-2, chloroplastic-like [Melia azedarach]|uniref:YlmG-like protein 1-2, chloroplastic-like n=2 Tax=Melia azedarach TaxID=155640 RepID=A0ACC1Z0A8_MELAZ|nr:ylmG-like protein 1-2, chloroplastic-like [Melia azedarach]KAJ4729070.1 ylmG-like protein 1-2, chloroplastic-like [Melia azedarach]